MKNKRVTMSPEEWKVKETIPDIYDICRSYFVNTNYDDEEEFWNGIEADVYDLFINDPHYTIFSCLFDGSLPINTKSEKEYIGCIIEEYPYLLEVLEYIHPSLIQEFSQ